MKCGMKFKVTPPPPLWGSGSTCCERRLNGPLMSLNVMPWPRPSARIIICTKPVWRLDLPFGEALGTFAQLCGGSGTPSLSNFGVIRHFFPPQPFYLSWSGGNMSPRPGPGQLAGSAHFCLPIVPIRVFWFRERLLNLHVLTVPSTEKTGLAELGHRRASALGI